jgi:GcrA cell cycle regulator
MTIARASDENLIAKMRKLWDAGASCSEIGRQVGLSKNSVVGRVHRLGFPPRPNPVTLRLGRPNTEGKPVTHGAKRLFKAPPAPPEKPVRTIRTKKCEYPLWSHLERPTHQYCGKPAVEGRGYCDAHHRATHIAGSVRVAAE